jgi:hypothetical protein
MSSHPVYEPVGVNPKSNPLDECPPEPSSLSNNEDILVGNGSVAYRVEHSQSEQPANGENHERRATEQTELTREYLEEFGCRCWIRSKRSAICPKDGSHC